MFIKINKHSGRLTK